MYVKILAARLAVLAIVTFLWELLAGGIVSGFQPLDPLIFSRPSLVAADLMRWLPTEDFLRNFTSTLVAALVGLALSIVVGTGLGLLLGVWRFAELTLSPYLAALNSLPRPAIAPLLVVWLGFGLEMKIAVAFFTAFFVVFYNVLEGYKSIDRDLQLAIMIMGGSRGHVIRHVVLPAVSNWVFASLRVAIAFSLIGAVLGEFVGGLDGLGRKMIVATGIFDTPRVYSVLIVLMLLGSALVMVGEAIERRMLRWRYIH